MKPTAFCNCNRGDKCGLVTAKLDELDDVWLPNRYLNYIKGSSFLDLQKEAKPLFNSKKAAVEAYLEYVRTGEDQTHDFLESKPLD